MSSYGWIGFDLDGTLAKNEPGDSIDTIGEPIARSIARVHALLAQGRDVRIFTARVSNEDDRPFTERQLTLIMNWCWKHIGSILPVTAKKDFMMQEFHDDRAVQYIPNTGERVDGKD